MRLTAIASLLPILLAGCAGNMSGRPPSEETPPPPAPDIAGIYELQSINDQGLPVLAGSWGQCRERIVSAGLALRADRSYVLSGTARQDCAGAAPVESRGGGAQGEYSVQGNIVRLDEASTPVEGAAEPGWIENPPGRRIAIGDLGGVGMLDGDTLTIRLDDGRIATFRRTQD